MQPFVRVQGAAEESGVIGPVVERDTSGVPATQTRFFTARAVRTAVRVFSVFRSFHVARFNRTVVCEEGGYHVIERDTSGVPATQVRFVKAQGVCGQAGGDQLGVDEFGTTKGDLAARGFAYFG